MAIEDIMKGVFPAQSIATDAAGSGVLGVGPMAMGDLSQGQMLMGLLGPQLLGGMGQQQSQGQNQYADWAPDQFLTGGGQQGGEAQGQPGQGMDPFSLLDQNINRRFGIS